MERIIAVANLVVDRVRGKNEFEIYKNYINDLTEEKLECSFKILFNKNSQYKGKDDSKSKDIRKLANEIFIQKNEVDHFECLHLYTKSLRYATYNGEQYALAVSNRSAVLFAMKDFKNCIADIELCLQANCPLEVKSKVLIRKAECFKEMGSCKDMRNTLIEALEMIDQLPNTVGDKYRKPIAELLVSKVEGNNDINENSSCNVPEMEENQSFINASNLVGFRHNKKNGYRVLAKKEIKRGDVLFVEKAFAFAQCAPIAATYTYGDIDSPFRRKKISYCHYCFALLTSCIPCKTCVKYVYCNENCRDSAWTEFHRWECWPVRVGMLYENQHVFLALRIIFKALTTGTISTSYFDMQEKIKTFGKKDDNYRFVYNLDRNIHAIPKHWLQLYATAAALWVRYLKKKTDFFKCMKALAEYSDKPEKELMFKIGGLIIKHALQLHANVIPVRVVPDGFSNPTVIAVAMCPSATIMNHSCVPNTAHYFINDTLIVRATEDIKSGEEIFRAYTSFASNISSIELTHANEEDRKTILKNYCFLDCHCKACSNPKMSITALNAYLCPRCKGPAAFTGVHLFFMKYYECLDCHLKTTLPQDMLERDRMAGVFLRRFERSHDFEEAIRCLDVSKSLYVPTHPLIGALNMELKKYHIDRGNVKEYLDCVQKSKWFCEMRRTNLTVEPVLILFAAVFRIIHRFKENIIPLDQIRPNVKTMISFMDEVKAAMEFYYPMFTKQRQFVESCAKLDEWHRLFHSENEN